jgi:aryl-alcohol dehydrogenase-like predicted oxidoreductase
MTKKVPICADKWCIFRNPSPPLTLQTIEEAVRERMQRTGIVDGIDILQIHWQDYSQPQTYLDLFRQLLELRGSRGAPRRLRIDVLGLVNFDSRRVNEICESMGPGEISTNQIQVRSLKTRLAFRIVLFLSVLSSFYISSISHVRSSQAAAPRGNLGMTLLPL